MSHSSTRRARLAYYLAWLPMTALVVLVLDRQGTRWFEAIGLAVGLCLPFSVVGGASFYMCRAMPLKRSGIFRVLPSLLTTSAAASGLWVIWAMLLGNIIGGEIGETLGNQLRVLFGLGIGFFTLSLAFHYLSIALDDIHSVDQKSKEAELLKREAELRALRAQVDPHFLFNSLNSITALTGIDPPKAGEMCRLLSDFLRISLKIGDERIVVLEKELALVIKYLEIEQVRFEDRMTFTQKIGDDCLKTKLPPLLLQPLIENAVKHGIGTLTINGEIRLTVFRAGSFCKIVVSNNYDQDAPTSSSKGRGLRITKERLLGFYGDEASMMVNKKDGQFEVTLTIPAEV